MTTMTTLHPQYDPVAISLGSLQIHWYGITYLLGFLAAYLLMAYRCKQRDGWTSEMVSDLMFYGMLGVILGGRVGYVLFYHFSDFIADPAYLFKIWEGGMSFHGGFLGVMIGMILYARKINKTPFQVMDFLIPAVPTGLMFGRLGNYINGELWGRVSDGGYNWLMLFPQAQSADAQLMQADPSLQTLAQTVATKVGEMALLPRHPSQLYEAFAEGLLLFILIWWYSSKPRPRMAVTGLFVLGYGLARFIIEFYRQPDADQGFILFGWMTKGQILTAPMIVVGIVLIIIAYRRSIFDWGDRQY